MFIFIVRALLFLVFAVRFMFCVLSWPAVWLSIFSMPLQCIVLLRLCLSALGAVFDFGLLSVCTGLWHPVCRTHIYPSQAIGIQHQSTAASRIVGNLALESCVLATNLPFSAALMFHILCAATPSKCRTDASFFLTNNTFQNSHAILGTKDYTCIYSLTKPNSLQHKSQHSTTQLNILGMR